MAFRDKTQGFGFVYVDIEKLLAQRDELKKNPLHPQAATAQSVNLNRDPQPLPVKKEETAVVAAPPNIAISQIRENLDRLQNLHHKLHAVLEELSSASTPRDKKKR